MHDSEPLSLIVRCPRRNPKIPVMRMTMMLRHAPGCSRKAPRPTRRRVAAPERTDSLTLLHKTRANLALAHRFTPDRTQSLAVDHAQAAQPPF